MDPQGAALTPTKAAERLAPREAPGPWARRRSACGGAVSGARRAACDGGCAMWPGPFVLACKGACPCM